VIRKIGLGVFAQCAVFSLAFAAGTPASNDDLAALKIAMEDRLKDADSAKFKNVRIGKDKATCGLVNSKNSYGAYVGFEPFMAVKLSSGNFVVIDVGEAAGQVCSKKGI